MHCLPVRRDLELSSELIDHPDCLIQQQAINRLHAAQAVLKGLLETLPVKKQDPINNLSLEEA